MMSLSYRDHYYLSEALLEAQKSQVLMRHGCVAVVNGRIRGRGFNSVNRTSSRDNFIKNTCSCHAEIACLRNLYYGNLTHTYGKKFNENIQYVQG